MLWEAKSSRVAGPEASGPWLFLGFFSWGNKQPDAQRYPCPLAGSLAATGGKTAPSLPIPAFLLVLQHLQGDSKMMRLHGKASPRGIGKEEEEQPRHPQPRLSAALPAPLGRGMAASQNPTPEQEQSCCVGLGAAQGEG